MPPRETSDSEWEDRAIDGIDSHGRADAAATAVDNRYGRTKTSRKRDRLLLALGAAGISVVVVSWVIWAGLDGSNPQIEATNLSHEIVENERAVDVTWRLSLPPGLESACIVEALNEDFTVVGWKVVEIPASEQHLRTFTERVRVAQPPNTGLIYECWPL